MRTLANKVPRVTFLFWVVKILATTLGETGGDAVTMTLNLGYAVGSLIFLAFFAITLSAQVATRRYHPIIYWLVVVATTTVGTTLSDYFDRSLGMGYIKSSIILFCAVLGVLFAWRITSGKVEYQHITNRRDEIFYWVAILVSNTLGTALGDFTADDLELGFGGGALLFGGLIALIAALHVFTKLPAALLFWAAYVLTRPLGATVGDLLTKPHDEGGLDLGRFGSSLVLAVLMAIGIWVSWKRTLPESANGAEEGER